MVVLFTFCVAEVAFGPSVGCVVPHDLAAVGFGIIGFFLFAFGIFSIGPALDAPEPSRSGPADDRPAGAPRRPHAPVPR